MVVETSVAVPPERGRALLFDLALDPRVHAASQSRYGEKVSAPAEDRLLELGGEVTFEARHLGLSWHMTARITALDRPNSFVDEQVRGPFDAFRHEHLFEPDGESTVMRDVFRFRLPGGRPGQLVARTVVAPYLRKLLRERGDHLRHLAESASSE